MTVEQRQRLLRVADIVRNHNQAATKFTNDLDKLAATTHLHFHNSGNCEGTVSFDCKEQAEMFNAMRHAAIEIIRREIAKHKIALDNLPPRYVEQGD